MVEPLEKEIMLQQVQGLSEKLRVKTPRWPPPEGKRRCGHNCTGCSKKCADQGLEDCHNCHIKSNIEEQTGEKVMSHICFNRGECVHPRDLRGRSTSKGGMAKTKVGSQSIVFKPGQVAESKDALDRQTGEDDKKRGREETGTTPDKEEQILKTPKHNVKTSGGSKSQLIRPGQIGGREARGGKPSATSL